MKVKRKNEKQKKKKRKKISYNRMIYKFPMRVNEFLRKYS